jgi:hypothetical protein
MSFRARTSMAKRVVEKALRLILTILGDKLVTLSGIEKLKS